MLHPEPTAGSLLTAVAVDENADPDVVEITLRAEVSTLEYLPGAAALAWTYGGSVPGPTIEAKVGDRVIVHFTNDLPESTTIHWHGVRVPNAMDGTPRVGDPVEAGESFDYDFVVLDAGIFWYHPHIRADAQMEKGLYGAIVVRDASEPAIQVVAEEVVVLDDVMVDPDTGALVDQDDERTEMMGREGNLLLVDGRPSNLGIDVTAGEGRRWRVLNAANSRAFRLALDGGRMVRIGGDSGLIEAPDTSGEILLTTGERADVIVWVDDPGATATLRALPYERAMGAGATEAVDLVRLVASSDPAVSPPEIPTSLRSIPTLAASGATRVIRLGERMDGDRMTFTINDAVFPDVPVATSSAGTVENWEIVNDTEMDHPFHIHGFRFQREGSDELEDTVNIGASETVRIIVDVDDREGVAGGWMYHCHILAHEEGGMMAELFVP